MELTCDVLLPLYLFFPSYIFMSFLNYGFISIPILTLDVIKDRSIPNLLPVLKARLALLPVFLNSLLILYFGEIMALELKEKKKKKNKNNVEEEQEKKEEKEVTVDMVCC